MFAHYHIKSIIKATCKPINASTIYAAAIYLIDSSREEIRYLAITHTNRFYEIIQIFYSSFFSWAQQCPLQIYVAIPEN